TIELPRIAEKAKPTMLAIASVCHNTHGTAATRVLRMASIPAVARSIAQLQPGILEQYKEIASLNNKICQENDIWVHQTETLRSMPFALTVTDAGAPPHRRVRYRFVANTTEVLEHRKKTTTATRFPDHTAAMESAEHVVSVSVIVHDVSPDGSALLAVTMQHSDDSALVGRFVDEAQEIDSRGFYRRAVLMTKPSGGGSWTAASESEETYYSRVPDIARLRPGVVRLPEEPVGVGAMW